MLHDDKSEQSCVMLEKMAEKCNSLKIEFLQMNPVSLITWVWTIYMHRSQRHVVQ